ncbi:MULTISPECIES: methylmalonyl-CoA mutase subunit beta [Mesorhizobium]|uniref:Methylmalonyl-CoA mutase n=1 Tax=Mesorhizobium denitrificans TaxID=2294114 RepID=A0A371XHU8_9HYPH|nr:MULTISPECIES: methylmalonyl-CoA mutase subunit beta [Mesorhizobium]RFC68789.1 methylmalonyl-CoA mutase [Mesorhizobium denitrificans]
MNVKSLLKEAEFAPADKERWLKLAEKALAGSPFEETLVSHTDDGLRIEPIYERAVDAQALPRKRPDMPWHIVQRVDDTDPARANAQALEDVENGATGLSLVFEHAPNSFGYGLPNTREALERALDGIQLNKTHVRVDVHPGSRGMAEWMLALLSKRRVDPSKLSLSFGIDAAAIFASAGYLRMSIEALKASMPQSLAHFFSLGLPGVLLEADGRVFHNAGATEAQELGIVLSNATSHLRMFEEARQALVYAAPHIGFALSVDQDQFMSIAKIRALRKLWSRIAEMCSIPPSWATVHAETSYRMMTVKDPETNILRTTIAAFAAAVGGADSISILPHTVARGLPDAFARRIARNQQLILTGESHIDFVADPARGAGGIEALTDELCEAAWKEFQQIENEGGALNSLAEGKIQARVLASRERRADAYRNGRAIVGTTIFPAPKERPVETLRAERRPLVEPTANHAKIVCSRIDPVRIDESLEVAS